MADRLTLATGALVAATTGDAPDLPTTVDLTDPDQVQRVAAIALAAAAVDPVEPVGDTETLDDTGRRHVGDLIRIARAASAWTDYHVIFNALSRAAADLEQHLPYSARHWITGNVLNDLCNSRRSLNERIYRRLAAGQFVAEYWHTAAAQMQPPATALARALGLVMAALDGVDDPQALGIAPVHHDLYRRAVDGGACAQTTTVDVPPY